MVMDSKSHIYIEKGDITTYSVDAIVNAANTSLLGGGGVDGAIHRAAGPELVEACRMFYGCNPGEARITKGFKLKAQFVIHTPGPIYRGGNTNEAAILEKSYENSLLLAQQNSCHSIAFPAISTGVYNYPRVEAAQIAITTVYNFIKKTKYILDVYFVLFDSESFEIYVKELDIILNK